MTTIRHSALQGVNQMSIMSSRVHNAPDISHAAYRMVRASERLRKFSRHIDLAVAGRSADHPIVRAPQSAPLKVEVSFEEIWGIEETHLRALTLLASEVIHHVRTSLDYLAYYVVWIDSGKRHSRTQFPLEVDSSGWNTTARKYIPGVSESHSSLIHGIQPFNGVSWARNLVQLSNRDKHRVPVEVTPSYDFDYDTTTHYLDPLGNPAFIGYQINDTVRMSFRFADGTGDDSEFDGARADEVLVDIIRGAADLMSFFLIEAGQDPLNTVNAAG